MTASHEDVPGSGWRKLAMLVLCIVAIGLPINNISDYALLVILTVAVFSGEIRTGARAWVAGIVIAAIAGSGQALLSPPRIQEGHNVFLPSPALERGLPQDVYRHLVAAFDAQYPPDRRCDRKEFGCWRSSDVPDSTFAFSADALWTSPELSRAVTALDFANPVWLRLGFLNELRYNWTGGTDVRRAIRDRRFWMGWDRWHVTMPWFEVISLPAAYVGGQLCWRGEVMWEGEGQHFVPLAGDNCRDITSADAGKRIVGIGIKPDTLAMHLTPPWSVRLQDFVRKILPLVAVAALIGILIRIRPGRILIPLVIVSLSALVIAVDDASFLGGLRPFDGGDDGLFYDGVGRLILQKILAGDLFGALEGGEKVFYYGGPGLRYFRALEHIFFGESYLGYLSLVLLFPFIAYALFRRFLPERWSLTLVFIFVAIPVGTVFGTSFVQYEQWASRGFADPAAYILFVAGLTLLVITRPDERQTFWRAFFAALLLALGIFMKPIIAPAAAFLLGGAGGSAIYLRQWGRLAGLSAGFLPVFSMAAHNWVYGHVFVLFSANAEHSAVLVMPPSAYAAAALELVRMELHGEYLGQLILQVANWLSGPAESYVTIPLNAAGVLILLYVIVRGRQFDPWLRLIGAAALAQHIVALFYTAAVARYHFLTWFLTMLVDAVWFHRVGIDCLKRHFPALSQQFAVHPWSRRLASGLAWLQKASA